MVSKKILIIPTIISVLLAVLVLSLPSTQSAINSSPFGVKTGSVVLNLTIRFNDTTPHSILLIILTNTGDGTLKSGVTWNLEIILDYGIKQYMRGQTLELNPTQNQTITTMTLKFVQGIEYKFTLTVDGYQPLTRTIMA